MKLEEKFDAGKCSTATGTEAIDEKTNHDCCYRCCNFILLANIINNSMHDNTGATINSGLHDNGKTIIKRQQSRSVH